MLDLGKKLFRNNLIQLAFIVICSALALLAQKLSFYTVHLSLNQYISGNSINYFPAQENFSFIIHVTLPSIAFFLSVILFIWLGITNFILFKEEDEKINVILRMILAILQTTILGFLLYTGGKIFFCFSLFLFIVVMMGRQILLGLTLDDR